MAGWHTIFAKPLAAVLFNIVERLGLTENRLARTVIGYGFEWLDLVAYTLGVATIVILEKNGRADSSRFAEAGNKT